MNNRHTSSIRSILTRPFKATGRLVLELLDRGCENALFGIYIQEPKAKQ